jgi:hypothetical protein
MASAQWIKSRLPRTAQPVPPIFPPEGAAVAIVWASLHDRGSMMVGGPTVATIIGHKIAPGWLGADLARTGDDGQRIDASDDPARPDNLWASKVTGRVAAPFALRVHRFRARSAATDDPRL